jgi:hypothetical protein
MELAEAKERKMTVEKLREEKLKAEAVSLGVTVEKLMELRELEEAKLREEKLKAEAKERKMTVQELKLLKLEEAEA